MLPNCLEGLKNDASESLIYLMKLLLDSASIIENFDPLCFQEFSIL